MKSIYDKTGLFDRLRAPVRNVFDYHGLLESFSKRPCLLPAILAVICSFACYYSSSFWPALIIVVLVFGICIFRFGKRSVTVGIILSLVLIYVGFFISARLDEHEDCVEGEFLCIVTDISYDLSGDANITVKLESGALASAKFYDFKPSVEIGDVLVTYGKLREPPKAGNPGEMDYREYLRSKGILYVLVVERCDTCKSAGFPLNITGFLKRFWFESRRYLLDLISDGFDEQTKTLAAAVCTGDKSLIDDSIRRDFKLSCCSHLLAVSGTHFSGFLVCVPFLINHFKLSREKGFVLHLISVVIIGCLTGWSDSVTRAAVMSVCLFADRDWLSALSVASLVMLIANPFSPLSMGFKMSFCAVIAIKIYSAKITEFLTKLHIPEVFAGVISVSVSATLGMIPFWTDISMRPDIEHLLIQIAASFVAQAACIYFIPCVFLCLFLPFWSGFLSAPLKVCLELLMKIVSVGSNLSEKGGYVVHFSKIFLVVLALFLFLFFIPPCVLKRVFLKISAVILAVFIGFEFYGFLNRSECTVVFADVGQGDCCLILTPESSCLIDAGTYSEGASTVSDLLDYYGIYQPDLCVMSHWDVDHAGGIAALYDSGRVGSIVTSYVPGKESTDEDVRDYFESVDFGEDDRSGFISCLEPVSAGERIVLSDLVYLEALYPGQASGGGNDDSLVLMLHIEGDEETKILFTGDIGFPSEELMVESGVDLDCDILKVAHHGSKYSSSREFIDACSPSVAVISVGRSNFYGHPSPETVERLENYGCEVFRTDDEGAVVMEYY